MTTPLEVTRDLMMNWATTGYLKGLDPDALRVKTVELLVALRAVEKPSRARKPAKTPEKGVEAAKPVRVDLSSWDEQAKARLDAQAPVNHGGPEFKNNPPQEGSIWD